MEALSFFVDDGVEAGSVVVVAGAVVAELVVAGAVVGVVAVGTVVAGMSPVSSSISATVNVPVFAFLGSREYPPGLLQARQVVKLKLCLVVLVHDPKNCDRCWCGS